MARRLLVTHGVGERLLTSKLQILTRSGPRRPSTALSILTGRTSEHALLLEEIHRSRRRYAARTVYLSERHLRDIERIIEVLSRHQSEPRRLTRSAVLRKAVEHLRVAVEAEPAKSMLEND